MLELVQVAQCRAEPAEGQADECGGERNLLQPGPGPAAAAATRQTTALAPGQLMSMQKQLLTSIQYICKGVACAVAWLQRLEMSKRFDLCHVDRYVTHHVSDGGLA